jgi:hypothetical protein
MKESDPMKNYCAIAVNFILAAAPFLAVAGLPYSCQPFADSPCAVA